MKIQDSNHVESDAEITCNDDPANVILPNTEPETLVLPEVWVKLPFRVNTFAPVPVEK